jgi:hypothetical protein
VDKQAVIVDERFNGGGALATDIVDFLSRKRLSGVATRDGEDEWQPQGAIFGPKVMLINEFARIRRRRHAVFPPRWRRAFNWESEPGTAWSAARSDRN